VVSGRCARQARGRDRVARLQVGRGPRARVPRHAARGRAQVDADRDGAEGSHREVERIGELGLARGDRDGLAATEQQRAWTSPIWYTPSKTAELKGDKASTVAALSKNGATPLDNAQLKNLLIGKTLAVKNTVTGERFEIVFRKDGIRTIQRVHQRPSAPDQIGELLAEAEKIPAQFEITNGRVSTSIGGLPFELVVFKSAGKYVAARSGEFGYANYEVKEVYPSIAPTAIAKR